MDWQTISNWALVGAVSVHICCEFGHYIHEFFCSRKNSTVLDDMHEHMERIENRLARLEDN